MDFVQEVDADRAVVAFFCEKDFDEVRGDEQLGEFFSGFVADHGLGGKGLGFRFPSLHKIAVDDLSCYLREGEGIKGPAHVSPGITQLQTPGQDHIEGRPRNDADLTARGNGVGKQPVGDARAHAALDNLGKCHRGSGDSCRRAG